jgi:uncharacterized MAPEG superfamily protein
MTNLIICAIFFYILNLFLKMSFSLHRVPFVQWTYTKGDTSNITPTSQRINASLNNLTESMPIFLALAILSVVLDVDNLMLAQSWLVLRVAYLLGAILNLYQYKMIRPLIWLPSIIVMVLMGCNLYI